MPKQLELPLKFPTGGANIPFEDDRRKQRDPFHQETKAIEMLKPTSIIRYGGATGRRGRGYKRVFLQ